jgi:hypothetical protein
MSWSPHSPILASTNENSVKAPWMIAPPPHAQYSTFIPPLIIC